MLEFEVWIAKFYRKLPENVEIFYIFDHFCHFCQGDTFDTKTRCLRRYSLSSFGSPLQASTAPPSSATPRFEGSDLRLKIVTLPPAKLSFIGFHRENDLFCWRWNILAPWCWNHVNIICFWQRLLNGTSISFPRSQRPLRFAHSPKPETEQFLKRQVCWSKFWNNTETTFMT